MIRIDSIWLATEPTDTRNGMDTALVKVVKVFGAARSHHAYLFTNKRSTRIKVLVYDGFGIWLASRRLSKDRITWVGQERSWHIFVHFLMRIIGERYRHYLMQ